MTTEHYTSPDGLDVDPARHGPRPARWPVGRPRRAGERGVPGRRAVGRDLRRPGERRGELGGAHRARLRRRPPTTAPASSRRRVTRRSRSRRTRAAGCATSAWSSCPTAATASTTRRPAPTAPTTCAPSCCARRCGRRRGRRGGPVTARLPDFLLLGAPKCGTSALHAALARHPGLFLSEPKEPKYFLTDGPPPTSGGGPGDVATWAEHVWRRADYEALFAAARPPRSAASRRSSTSTTAPRRRASASCSPTPGSSPCCGTPRAGPLQLGAPARTRAWNPRPTSLRARPRGRAHRRGLGALLALRRAGPLRRAARPPLRPVPARAGAAAPLPRAARRPRRDARPGLPVPRRRDRRDQHGAAAQRAARRARTRRRARRRPSGRRRCPASPTTCPGRGADRLGPRGLAALTAG